MKWFGIAMVEPTRRATATPVGVPCGFCQEPISAEDHGCTIPGMEGGETPLHVACHIRLAVGSPAHQPAKRSSYGGAEDDPTGMMLRAPAVAAFEYWIA
jgi:hypothetical protein